MPKARPEPIELMMNRRGGDQHDADASVAVGDLAGEPRADRAAEQGGCHGEAEQHGARVELLADGRDRAVDDGGVVAEEESAERGGGRDQDDPGDGDGDVSQMVPATMLMRSSSMKPPETSSACPPGGPPCRAPCATMSRGVRRDPAMPRGYSETHARDTPRRVRDPAPRRRARCHPDEEARAELRRRRQHRAADRAGGGRARRRERRRGRTGSRLADPRDPRGRGIRHRRRDRPPAGRAAAARPRRRTASPTGRCGSWMPTRCASRSCREIPTVLVANLPYNVSVPVLLHFLEHFPGLQRGVVMVQSEVGERLAAPPGSKIYGAPSIKAAWYGRWRLAGNVSRQVFWPVPNVDSVLVAFERAAAPLGLGGRAQAHLPDRGCRVPAAPQDAAAGALGRSGRQRRRGIRRPGGGGSARPPRGARSSAPSSSWPSGGFRSLLTR